MSGSSQTAPPSDFPNLMPSALVMSGVVSACTGVCSTRRIRSTPGSRAASVTVLTCAVQSAGGSAPVTRAASRTP
jgi:hypothetical protein